MRREGGTGVTGFPLGGGGWDAAGMRHLMHICGGFTRGRRKGVQALDANTCAVKPGKARRDGCSVASRGGVRALSRRRRQAAPGPVPTESPPSA
jgi:hypothetical protein